MNILHTENSLGWGGQEIRILTEAAGMIRRGHEVQLIAPRESRIFEEAPARGVPVTALPIAKKRPSGFFALRHWLKMNSVDVINSHSSTDSWLAALACAIFAPWYYLLGDRSFWYVDKMITLAIVAMSAFLAFRHRENINKLLKGTESRLGAKKKGP